MEILQGAPKFTWYQWAFSQSDDCRLATCLLIKASLLWHSKYWLHINHRRLVLQNWLKHMLLTILWRQRSHSWEGDCNMLPLLTPDIRPPIYLVQQRWQECDLGSLSEDDGGSVLMTIIYIQLLETLYPVAFRKSCCTHHYFPFKSSCKVPWFFSVHHETRDVLLLKIGVTAFLHVQSL